jgi:two-component system sensor histidine kinase HydH
MIRIDVSDSGSGLSEQQIAEIFTPGYTTKDRRSHEGLGLTLVQNVVERHGGTVSVDSEPGSGSLFSVELPVAPVEELVDA